MNPEAILEHYGVKGMKWGVRKDRSGKAGTARTHYKKSPKNLTDSELARRIKRMETEKRYNQLNRPDVSEGQRIAQEILTTVGRRIVTSVLSERGTSLARSALTPTRQEREDD